MKKIIMIILLIISGIHTQSIENIFSEKTSEPEEMLPLLNRDGIITNMENITYTPIEKPINPNTYIIGPGDLIGINIISTENISFQIRVNPVGDIMIPLVGVLNISGISLADVKIMISDYIVKTAFKNAIINVTLSDIRRFKIQVLGAVYNPGFIEMTPIDRVYDAILQAGGVQKYAHPDSVRIIRNEKTISVKLTEYLSGKNITENISLKEGDIVFVPFRDNANLTSFNYTTYNKNPVIVYGFVHRGSRGNSFKYYPGYTARDYIAMAGGTKEAGSIFKMGNINKTTIYRPNGVKIKNAIDKIVLPGDMIKVPPSLLYQTVGRDGAIRTVASIISSTYLIYRFTIE